MCTATHSASFSSQEKKNMGTECIYSAHILLTDFFAQIFPLFPKSVIKERLSRRTLGVKSCLKKQCRTFDKHLFLNWSALSSSETKGDDTDYSVNVYYDTVVERVIRPGKFL